MMVDTPPNAYPLRVACFNCGQEFDTYTEANMSDPEQAEIVTKLMRMVLCNKCKGHKQAADIDFTRSQR